MLAGTTTNTKGKPVLGTVEYGSVTLLSQAFSIRVMLEVLVKTTA
jgi:hypothetical protein